MKGLAYGALTTLPPVNGLYTSLYPGLTYSLFGTSRHLSVGTFAVTSLMVYSTINRMETDFLASEEYLKLSQIDLTVLNNTDIDYRLNQTNLDLDNTIVMFRIKVASSLAFWCGFFQVLYLQITYVYVLLLFLFFSNRRFF